MANTYRDMTGVLVLDCVTPVIRALFGAFSLDETDPGNGQVKISKMAESGDGSWASVKDGLADLVSDLGLTLPDGAGETVEEYLYALASHFELDGDTVLQNLIENTEFSFDADLDALFDLAIRFDDGHGLKYYKSEAAWHCDKARLFEFGGYGEFCGRHAFVGVSSSDALSLGQDLDVALQVGDTDRVAQRIRNEVETLLSGISDEGMREAVRTKLGVLILESAKPYYAVAGRIPDSGEEQLFTGQAASKEEAIAAFEKCVWEDAADDERRQAVLNGYGQAVFVDAVAESKSPIRLVH